jgi:hypothetical protein
MRLSERFYRVALRVYPARYRAAREDEILATLAEGQGDRVLPRAGELVALVRSGLGERNRVDLAQGARWWWRGLGSLAVPLTCVNAAVALAGLWVAWSLPNGLGHWWPTFAALAVALAVAAAARLSGVATVLGLANLALVGLDAATMARNGAQDTPHLRILEHYPSSGTRVPLSYQVLSSGPAHPDPSASVPSNPTELVPFAVVLGLACLGAMLSRKAGPGARARAVRASLTFAVAAGLAGIALADPDGRFAFLLVPALALAALGLVSGLFYARAAVVAVAILVASAPSVFWYLSASLRIEQLGDGFTSATRDVVPGLIAVGCMIVAAGLAGVFARRAARTERDALSR